jgi:hypothetical protein
MDMVRFISRVPLFANTPMLLNLSPGNMYSSQKHAAQTPAQAKPDAIMCLNQEQGMHVLRGFSIGHSWLKFKR